jgi:parallel beta-helix repeat protein
VSRRDRWRRSGVCLLAVAVVAVLGADQALASHVRCGDAITQDTKLDSDLVNCAGDGIVIGASDITLDLGGHTIDGTGRGRYSGVRNGVYFGSKGYDRVTIKNGAIRNFGQFGVLVVGVDANALRDLVVSEMVGEPGEPGGGIAVGNSWAPNGGWPLEYPSHTVIEGNTIVRNLGALGVIGSENLIRGNLVTENYSGIGLGGDRDRIEENIVSRNRTDGISLIGADENRVEENSVFGNRRGIRIATPSDNNRLEENSVTRNGTGLILEGTDKNTMEENLVTRNYRGIVLASHADQNRILRNSASENLFAGIVVNARRRGSHLASGTLVEGNTANHNGVYGVRIRNRDTTVTGNTANHNGGLGIEAVPGVTDGGGNRASGNGDPAQCANVSCQ